jgi:hypothetical protein
MLAKVQKEYLEAYHWRLTERGWLHDRVSPVKTVSTWDAIMMTKQNKLLAAYAGRLEKT